MVSLPSPANADVRQRARSLGVTVTAASILAQRGLVQDDEVTRFFEPRLAHLTPPSAMKDRSEAAERIARAVKEGERICVFGDYDADGITSAAIMTDVLRHLGGNVVTLLADRFRGGYGLSAEALQRVVEAGPSLLITCDCGSSDHERVDQARLRGMDVVVIDHHRVPEEPLPAFAFLNPHRPDCGFPYKGLASCGLALSIAAAVRTALGQTLDLRRWLDLVALGTIADVAPLDGDNRALVRAGLAALVQGTRPGIRALAQVAGVTGGTALTGEDVAFRFAPRINAPGRLASPDKALQLLLATTDAEARVLAAEVDAACQERKAVDRAILEEALLLLQDPAMARLPVIVLGKQGWHQGVVGIVAGRLASRFGKPTVVIGFDGDSGRGSVRGPAGFHLYDALAKSADALRGFGGHQAAAGVHLDWHQLDAFRDRFAQACEDLGAGPSSAPVAVADAVLEEYEEPSRVLRDLDRFEPCGHRNPAPLLGLGRVRVASVRALRGGHLSLDMETGTGRLAGFGFEMGDEASRIKAAGHVQVLGKLRWDTYRGNGAVQFRVEAVEALA